MGINLKLTGKGSSILKKTTSGINRKELTLALAEATACGAGIDLDYGFVVLPNYNSSSGDIDEYLAAYIVDGAWVFDTVANAKSAICTFRSNDFVSAESVSITGCLVGTPLVEGVGTRQLTAVVLPSGALQTGAWTTSAAGVATVNSSGLVTAVAAGTATITFTANDGDFTATCVITVTE